ncbi:hypothetical protein TRIP_B200551 [uncultured Desulfatiglans sp.]|nr:hypothetical protein TRIP_B200551 [uncultured Desulfatiglans sp.]
MLCSPAEGVQAPTWIPSGNGLFGQSRRQSFVCLCGDLQVASAQAVDFLDIGQKSPFQVWKLSCTGKSLPDGDHLVRDIQPAWIGLQVELEIVGRRPKNVLTTCAFFCKRPYPVD